MKKGVIVSLVLMITLLFVSQDVSAQCAMCKAAAEEGVKGGNMQSATLNSGILYLLVMPYLAFAVVGYLWYRNYKRKKAAGAEF